jgi:TOBE domain-containing protein
VEVMIRPEQIRLDADGVLADVLGHQYYGPDSLVQLRLRDGLRTSFTARTFEIAVPEAGEVVGVVVSGPVAVYPVQDA